MKSVHKVWLYLVRSNGTQPRLLVFEHSQVDAGIQIPAGTVEPNEDLVLAAHRELFEETGIRVSNLTPFGELQREWNGEFVNAHWFWSFAPDAAPDEWTHQVSGGGEDGGMQFRCYWLPQNRWQTLFGDFKAALPRLEEFIKREFSTDTK